MFTLVSQTDFANNQTPRTRQNISVSQFVVFVYNTFIPPGFMYVRGVNLFCIYSIIFLLNFWNCSDFSFC